MFFVSRAFRSALLVLALAGVCILTSCDFLGFDDEGGIDVVAYDGPSLEPEGTTAWSVSRQDDLVILVRRGVNQEGQVGIVQRVAFRDAGGELPEFVSYESSQPSYHQLGSGTVQIEHWNPDGGIISGHITGQTAGGGSQQIRATFWAELD